MHSTFSDVGFSIGNITIRNVKGEIGYSIPTDAINIELDARGNQISASNVQSLIRTLTINIAEGSQEDLLFRSIMDAQNRITTQKQSLIGLSGVFSKYAYKNGVAGLYTFTFKNIMITKRAYAGDNIYSTDGDVQQSRIIYTLSGTMPFLANEGVFYPL